MPIWFAVALGGASGSLARWGVVVASERWMPGFPLGTGAVNLLGSLLFGVLAGSLGPAGPAVRAGVFAGFLGGFTTFSALAGDTAALVGAGRAPAAVGNLLFQNAGGVVLLVLGLRAGEWLRGG